MADGSVIVDLAVERGGNVEGAVPGEVAKVGGVTIIGHLNMAGRIAASSSALLARNIYRLRRADDRQGDEGALDQARRRDRRRDAADRGRRDRASGIRAEAGGRQGGQA